jgi:hypothetical protein
MCPRNVNGGAPIGSLAYAELSLRFVESLFNPEFVKKQQLIYACGTFGDPIVARDTFEIFSYFRNISSDVWLNLHTNGSARSVKWWSEFGQLLSGTPHKFVFGIDGLSDTNHIYRRHTSFQRIIENASAFIENGGVAEWTFIAFKHNEHQIEQAKKLADKIGFVNFSVKKTVIDRKGGLEYFLEPPVNTKYRNLQLDNSADFFESYSDYKGYLSNVGIACKAANNKSVYITSEGIVLPCCWLGGALSNRGTFDRAQFQDRLATFGGQDGLDGNTRTLAEIIEGPVFQKMVPNSWGDGAKKKNDLMICGRFCGIDFNSFLHQGKTIETKI